MDCLPVLWRHPLLEGCGQQRHHWAAFYHGLVAPRTGAIQLSLSLLLWLFPERPHAPFHPLLEAAPDILLCVQ